MIHSSLSFHNIVGTLERKPWDYIGIIGNMDIGTIELYSIWLRELPVNLFHQNQQKIHIISNRNTQVTTYALFHPLKNIEQLPPIVSRWLSQNIVVDTLYTRKTSVLHGNIIAVTITSGKDQIKRTNYTARHLKKAWHRHHRVTHQYPIQKFIKYLTHSKTSSGIKTIKNVHHPPWLQ